MNNTVELKRLVNDKNFIDNMNKAFSDLRADYELTMDSSTEKIRELQELHVDVKNHLSDLTSLSRKSSGTICGLRGTGKTHLMLLARYNLNNELWKKEQDNNLCIYLNMKRLCLPENCDDDTFNRVFSIFIYEELSEQLLIILKALQDKNLIERIQSRFKKKDRSIQSNIQKALLSIYNMSVIAREGNEIINNIGAGSYERENVQNEIQKVAESIGASWKETFPELNISLSEEEMQEVSTKLKTNNTFYSILM